MEAFCLLRPVLPTCAVMRVEKHSPRYGFAVLALLGACAAGPKNSSDPSRPILEDRAVLDRCEKDLEALQQQFGVSDAAYTDARSALLTKEPRAAPWIAKWMVTMAVADADRWQASGVVPERAGTLEKNRGYPLYRARRELAELGPTGRRAIFVYLLRDRRTQLRSLAKYLLEAHDPAAVRQDLMREYEAGNEPSKREVLSFLAELGPDPASEALLERCLEHPDWQQRGTAIRALGVLAKDRPDKSAFVARAWQLATEDRDAWVRGRALLALADAGAVDQVRALVDRLEQVMSGDRGSEIAAAIEALRDLTGRDYGSSVSRWREWLDGSSRGQ